MAEVTWEVSGRFQGEERRRETYNNHASAAEAALAMLGESYFVIIQRVEREQVFVAAPKT